MPMCIQSSPQSLSPSSSCYGQPVGGRLWTCTKWLGLELCPQGSLCLVIMIIIMPPGLCVNLSTSLELPFISFVERGGWDMTHWSLRAAGKLGQLSGDTLKLKGFAGGSVVKNPPASAGDMGSIPGLGQSRMPQDNKAMSHNYWACALEPRSCNYGAHVPQVRKPTCLRAHAPQQEKPLQWEARTLQLERSPCSAQFEKSLGSNEDPAQPKRNK